MCTFPMIEISDSSSTEENDGKDEFENIMQHLAPKSSSIHIEEDEEEEEEDYKHF